MNMKHLALLGALALVVLGCVIAAGCTSVPTAETAPQTEDNPMVGQWQTICEYNGKPYSAIMILNPDGSAAWYTYRDVILAASSDYTEDTPGSMFFDEVWKATGDTTLTVQNMDAGALFPGPFQYVFDPVNQTIQELSDDPVGIFTRVDDIVGIWSGPAKETAGTATSVMMLHGIGFSSVVAEDGTVEYTGLTWTKNADGTYAVAYRNGDSRTYTVSQDGTTLTTDDGRMKTKCSPSMIQVAAVVGPWYNKEMMKIISLNADGTGILKGKDVTAVFTWKADGTGKYIFTVTDGKDATNASLKGNEIVVTFDNIHNALIDSEGNTFVRPAETVKDLIQVH